jgi:hypothetical protein
MFKRIFWVLVALATGAFTYWWPQIEHWFSYGTGSYNTPGSPHNYNFNSGWGSILEPFILQVLAAVALLWWHNQCHVDGCYWPSKRHKTAAGDSACWLHHPHKRLTREQLHLRHHEAKRIEAKLDEIHEHVTAIEPQAGSFPPPSEEEQK